MRPEERSSEQIKKDQAYLRRFRFCPACCRQPCECTDEATDLLLEEAFWDLGPTTSQSSGTASCEHEVGDKAVQVTIVPAGRCPQGILWAGHFRADGSCECEPEERTEADR